jgi:hypothetical protein
MGSLEQFESFRRIVLFDPALERRLRSIPDWPSFVAEAVDAAAEQDLALTEADLSGVRR